MRNAKKCLSQKNFFFKLRRVKLSQGGDFCFLFSLLKKAISIMRLKRLFLFDLSSSDPEGTQTPDLQNRNLTFYSTELPGHSFSSIPVKRIAAQKYKFFLILKRGLLRNQNF